ncbi:MAG: hypothetical protein PHC61_17925, partial [Chitinivibrionales bacterium]|nr:hypothetical protein [Chitinivibrionales bacterium]
NNGTIRNNPTSGTIDVEIYGNIINNGTWTPDRTCIASSQVQTISQAAGTEFSSWINRKNYYGTSDTFALVAASDLVFNLSSYGYDGMGYKTTTPNYFWSVLDMAHHNLTLKGGTALGRAVLFNTATLTMQDSSTIYDLSIRDAITLAGTITCTNANITFNGTTTNQGIFQNGGSFGWLTPVFNGTLINNGVIRSNPKGNTLHLNLYGDAVNNGIWTPGTAYFGATKKQTISQQAGTEFQGNFKRTNSDGYSDTFALAAGTNLTLNLGAYDGMGYKTTVPNYFWSVFDMAHHNLTLKSGTTFGRAVVWNSATITSLDSSTLYDLSIRDSITLAGATTFTNGNVTLNGFATVTDTLQNGGALGWFTITAAGGLYNKGVIRNNPKGNALQIAAGQNIINAGLWKNDRTTLVDSVNQTVTLVGGAPIISNVRFQALWANGPYQWQRADTNWGGGNKELSWDSLTLAAAGVYRCKKADSISRSITVQNGSGLAVKRPGKDEGPALRPLRQFSYSLIPSRNPQLRITTPAACAFQAQLTSLNGKVVADVNGTLAAGENIIRWNRTVSQGAYLLRLTAGSRSLSRVVAITEK